MPSLKRLRKAWDMAIESGLYRETAEEVAMGAKKEPFIKNLVRGQSTAIRKPIRGKTRQEILDQSITKAFNRKRIPRYKLKKYKKSTEHLGTARFDPKAPVWKSRSGKPVGGRPYEEYRRPIGTPTEIKPRPKLQITNKQWQALSERIAKRAAEAPRKKSWKAAREPGVIPAEEMPNVNEIMGQFAPPVEKPYGRLYENIYSKGQGEVIGRQPRDYPYMKAMERRSLYPEKYEAPGGKRIMAEEEMPPPVDQMSVSPKGELKYERKSFEKLPITQERAGQLKEIAKTPSDVELRGKKYLESVNRAMASKMVNAPVDRLILRAAVADMLWKKIGQGRSVTGRLWDRYRKSAGGRKKVKLTRDYFVQEYLKFKEAPEQYAKAHKLEANSLRKIEETFGPTGE